MHAVRYRLYYSAGAPLNSPGPDLRTATAVIDLIPTIPSDYTLGRDEALPYGRAWLD